MIVFGVELKGSEAIVVVVEKDSNDASVGVEYKRIPLNSTNRLCCTNLSVKAFSAI